ncbi:hypothetical protein [Actinocorallia longicatena]|uniref:Secreted protein n=1 Tax=Actinocorallia longicatena TaxID=111803 RepID=A0ABP6QFG4_9ACTN
MRRFAIAASGAGAIALVFSTPAFAAGTWTATNAGPVTATSSNISFQDVTAGITANCTSGSAAGSVIASGSWPSGTAASLTSLSTSGCSGAGITFNLTANISAGSPWSLKITGPTSGGITPGSINGASVHATALGGLCSLDADGPGGANSHTGVINGSYNNNGTLTATGSTNIKLYNVSWGCLGIVKNGDVATLTGTFAVTGAGGVPVITAV